MSQRLLIAGLIAVSGGCGSKRSAPGGPPGVVCPQGTTPYEWTSSNGVEQRYWCQDESGLEQGPYRVYLAAADGGVYLRTEGAFSDGDPEGTFTSWYENGELWKDQGFHAGFAHGPWIEHWDDGSLYAEREFRFGIACGTWRLRPLPSRDLEITVEQRECAPLDGLEPGAPPPPTLEEPQWDGAECPAGRSRAEDEEGGARRAWCTTPDGALDGPYAVWFVASEARMIDGAFAAGKRSGTWRVFFGDGRLHERGDYASTGEAGEREGLWTTFRPSGARLEEGSYSHGVREGDWRTYWPNDAVASEGAYVHGEEDGSFTSWDPEGTVLAEETYAAGVLDGPAKRFYPDGALEEEGAHAAGQRVGDWVRYWPDGIVQSESRYRAGRLDGTWRSYQRTGQLSAELEYVLGVPEGRYRQWFYPETGIELFEATFVHGAFEGEATLTGEGGQRLQLYHYREGLRDGAFSQWYPSGAPHFTGSFLADRRHGVWTELYEAGGVRQVCRWDRGMYIEETCHAYLEDGTEVPWTPDF